MKEPVAQTAFQLHTPAHGVAAGAGGGLGGVGRVGGGAGAAASGTLTDCGFAAIRIPASGLGPTFAAMRSCGPDEPFRIVIRRRTLASSSSRS
ncbi:MAG: hypothetical protein M5T61_17645 [Acidimicrobiia bacterium]|nr:hypothetical protein [Acidimicrobiia bacterium]